MDTKASSKVSYNANRGVLLKLQESGEGRGGLIFTNSPRKEGEGEVVRGKLQTNTVSFVCFFSKPPEKPESVFHSDPTTTSVSNCWLTKKKEREGEGGKKNTMQLLPYQSKQN